MLPHSGRPFDATVLATADSWAAETTALAIADAEGVVGTRGPLDAALPWASTGKLLVAYAVHLGVHRGILGLDAPAGPPGSTVRHLLAHASGLAPDEPVVLSAPGRMRIYSNAGFDVLGAALAAAAGRPLDAVLRSWVLDPLAMAGTRLDGRPSSGIVGPARDLAAFALELLRPRLLPPEVLADATRVAFPGLRGVLPGIGRMDPNDWGLGFELRDGKVPHWTGRLNAPVTFGHFGRSGTFLWVDPVAGLAFACLTDRDFGPWALEAWPAISDAVLVAASAA